MGQVKNARVATRKGRSAGAAKASPSEHDYAVYDGQRRLGSVKGLKAGGYAARGPTGARLGQFDSVKAAANRLASVAGGVQ